MFAGLEHVAICAKDTAALAKWYCDVLGFRVCYDNKKQPPSFFVKEPGGSMLEIMPAKGPQPKRAETDAGLAHLAVSVTDFDAAYAALKAKGVSFTGEPKEASGGVRVVFFSDIEGNLVQIIYRPNPL